MENRNSNTAIVIFAHSQAAELRQKRLLQSKKQNIELFDFLNKKSIALAKETNLPHFVISEQNGETFGSRLGNALQSVFDKGFDHIIAIGNDCPSLTLEQLIKANDYLIEGKQVIGPDQRNGAYLIGLSKEIFDLTMFTDLRWRTKHTIKDLFSFLGHVELLDQAIDLNFSKDIYQYLLSDDETFQSIVATIVGNQKYSVFGKEHLLPPIDSNANLHRGPPEGWCIN